MQPTDAFNELTKLPNIGKVLAQRLIEVGITTKNQLVETGYERTFLLLQSIDPGACIQELHAVAGAVWDIKTNQFTIQQKEELKLFYYQAKKAL